MTTTSGRSTLLIVALGLAVSTLVGCDPQTSEAAPRPPSPAAAPTASADRDTAKPAQNVQEEAFRLDLVQRWVPDLQEIARHRTIVEAVEDANRANDLTLDEILAIDERWRQSSGSEDPLVTPYLTNDCAMHLKSVQLQHPQVLELFVMDDRGCIVGESDKTSDYWQGDEAKWTECFNGGDGQVFAGDIEYDQSTRAYVIQISLPIRDDAGNTIGAMTASVRAQGD